MPTPPSPSAKLVESSLAHKPKILALVAPTASGKTDLALELATTLNAEIFSIDSLSIYKEINIASAKPSKGALQAVHHHAINILSPNEHCNAEVFRTLFAQALQVCKKEFLLIVGGSGFYLTCLYEGLSAMPSLSQEERSDIQKRIEALPDPYAFLTNIDPQSALRIAPTDTYRVQKLLSLYFATYIAPSTYFSTHTKSPLIQKPRIYTIHTPKPELHARIEARTKAMLDSGLLDEARYLLAHYGRTIEPFKAIGLKECLRYFDGELESSELEPLIITHTRQLAKRQATYIRAKFQNAQVESRDKLLGKILRECAQDRL
ncbi:tRNA (adenosine(37)-N6)-dimethylallyltransferase MiaA [Helicobacter sp.]|uniref:tRNA (adenosine(37)-N6)-dimethylallyltransferase MiaA n=1 Tax=Helicobacter sp. TaxID=218 RepID=UPI0025BC6550|nr:tRNA (adenosine(37)-N6)-dimethylallyltransferase MiaA [Helicobacter sp.]MBR2494590.1 tRNA (adenosine(37)-N6)-dimethylallyltransferase MiaA [Helicobacter sp.]